MPPRRSTGTVEPPAEKIVLTNLGALGRKHGRAGRSSIRTGVRALVAADAARGVHTRLIAMDDGRSARGVGAAAVRDVTDAAATKAFVDAAVARWKPDYVLLLGSPDVVAMPELTNPLWTGDPRGGDPDPSVPSDLPYACDAPYSTDPGDFVGATRVVGRLPDGTGSTDPAQLLALLTVTTGWHSRTREQLLPPFALSAQEWAASTATTLARVVSGSDALLDVPPSAPPWSDEQLGRLLHLLNLHGGVADPRFYGQKGRSYPIALDAADLSGRLRVGAVAAAESCYGGMLYDPKDAGGRPGFADAYLHAGAYGYCASTTTAYGPSAGNDAADLICGAFLKHVLGGTSLGRALLQARQDYVFTKATLSPVDLKTLAQFLLLGDPAVHPVAKSELTPKGRSTPPIGISARRRRLHSNGIALGRSTTRASATPRVLDARAPSRIADALPGPAAATSVVASYQVRDAPDAVAGPQEQFHVVLSDRGGQLSAVVTREEGGRVQQRTTLLAR